VTIARHVYFGGSFDPPHRGHHEMLVRLVRDPQVDFVHVVPTGKNPLKESQGASAEQRLAWVEAWLKALRQEVPETASKLRLETLEIDAGRANAVQHVQYTVDTLSALQEAHSGRWVLAVGADILPQLSQWREPARLLGSLEGLWIFPRGRAIAEDSFALIPTVLRGLCSQRWMGGEILAVSSTELRAAFRNGGGGSDALQKSASLLAPGVLPVSGQ